MHLRLDRPERGRRLARWVASLNPDDALYLVGDVCDFWFASRQAGIEPTPCPGLRTLGDFTRRGGVLTIVLGNHDHWLGPYYERTLGARILDEPAVIDAFGLRVRVVHGHRSGGRQAWKAFMETRAFLKAFGALPEAVAARLSHKLDESNDETRTDDEDRLLPYFRRQLPGLSGEADLAVFGHVHRAVDEPDRRPRFIVLGGWQRRSSYLRVDERGAELVIVPDPESVAV